MTPTIPCHVMVSSAAVAWKNGVSDWSLDSMQRKTAHSISNQVKLSGSLAGVFKAVRDVIFFFN